MSYPTNRTTFKLWIKQQADENAIGVAPFSGNAKLENIIDSVVGEYSAVSPLLSLGTIEINGRYAILFDDWVDGSELNTSILHALQRGQDPTLIDLSQSGYDYYSNSNQSIRFGSSIYSGNGYGLGTGSASRQEPFIASIGSQLMPQSSSAVISNVQKKVFLLPTQNFSTGQTFEVRYGALHKIQDAATGVIAMMTIPREDLADIFDKIFARAIKARIFFALNANEVAGEDKHDISRLDKLASHNPFTSKY